MPMRLYRATSRHVGAHLGRNMWAWVGISFIAMVIASFLYWKLGRGAGILGDAAALFGCIAGILVMVQSQVGYISLHAPPPDDDEDLPVVAPVSPVP
jgi:hypothetical protein